jgi:hypothetical protein
MGNEQLAIKPGIIVYLVPFLSVEWVAFFTGSYSQSS